MKITCFGARGSLPAPSRKGFSTIKYGGNTNCYFIQAGPFLLILDDGSGVHVLGDWLMKLGMIGRHFINLLTHFHWDHIQGLPFSVPYFVGVNTFHFHGPIPSGHEASGQPRSAVEAMLATQQANPHFPVAHECLPAGKLYNGHDRQFSKVVAYRAIVPNPGEKGHRVYRQIETHEFDAANPEHLRITTIPLNHPDGCLGYRIDWNGESVAYCTDLEPFRKPHFHTARLAAGVQWIILDGQYTDDELGGMNQGFGHGSPDSCLEQAIACKAKHLVVHHHDIRRADSALDAMEADLKAKADAIGFGAANVEFAREGVTWTLDGANGLVQVEGKDD